MKKNVVMILTNGFDPDVRVYKEGVYLVKRGFDVTILCWDRDLSKNYPACEEIDGVHIKRFKIPSVYGTGLKQLPKYLKFMKKCHTYLKLHKSSYIHCNDLDGAVIGYLFHGYKCRKVFDMHEFYERGNAVKKRLSRRIVIRIIKNFGAALYENAVYLEEPYKSVQRFLYPLRNYPDSEIIQFREKEDSNLFRIGYHGVVRGQILEFKALFEAVKELDDVRVDINGGGMDLEQLRQMEPDYHNVYIHGPYNGIKESTCLYMNTDLLFCAYSPEDPNYQGDAEVIKFYEAIFTGTPILVTKNIGMEKKVLDNTFGLSCDTRNPEEIKKAILKMKDDKEYWNKCHESELLFAPNYSWDNAVKILDKIYLD